MLRRMELDFVRMGYENLGYEIADLEFQADLRLEIDFDLKFDSDLEIQIGEFDLKNDNRALDFASETACDLERYWKILVDFVVLADLKIYSASGLGLEIDFGIDFEVEIDLAFDFESETRSEIGFEIGFGTDFGLAFEIGTDSDSASGSVARPAA